MKNIFNIILLVPILFYVILLLINTDLLVKKESINLFWINEINVPLIALISVFFILYIFVIYFSGKFSSFFTNSKVKFLENEKLKLKEKLADMIPEIEKNMEEKFDKVLIEFKDISNKNLELHKNQTKQVLENLEFDIKMLKEKIEKLKK